jgi:hypothetical protein
LALDSKSKKNEKNIIQIDVDATNENLFHILNQEDFTNEFIAKKNIKANKEFYNLVCAKIETNNGYTNKSISVKGLIMHTAFAVNQEGLPLGILDQKIYARSNEELKSVEDKNDPHLMSIENKESIKWLNSLKNFTNNIDMVKTKIVTVCDREADIYDFFELADNLKSDILVRAAQDRVINKKTLHAKKDNQKLWDVIESLPCQGVIDVEVPVKNNQPKRTAHLEVRFGKFTMNPPKKNIRNKTENLSNLSIYAVYIVEKHFPEGTDPLEWMLLTNISINTFDEAIEKVRWYCLRWKIETFHKILKSGLKVESCRLSTAERLIRYLTIMSIIAWRIFFITLISRVDPNLPCTIVLDKEEFRVLYAKMYLSKFSSNTEIPTIKKAIIWIAQLGGYLARNNDPPPGPTVVWRGWKRLFDLTEGWKLFGMINTCG